MQNNRFEKAAEFRISTPEIYYFNIGFTLYRTKELSLLFFGKQLVSRKIGSSWETEILRGGDH
jgi:hypothetical protein